MRVLITGKGSFVGSHIKKWLEKSSDIVIDELDMLDPKWNEYDFDPYDTVIHVAAIVHRKNENISWNTYHEVNTKMAVNVATKAKLSGVKHFIFFSSMAVYGQGKKLPHGNVIDHNTKLHPQGFYGRSKLEAEIQIKQLNSKDFVVSIVRPPNIYGSGCPGNYINTFTKIVMLLPVFPKVYEDCVQSFLYIDNLCEYIRVLVNRREAGIFCPQDSVCVSTNELILEIAKAKNKKIYFSNMLGKIIKLFELFSIIRKIYGGVSYDQNLSKYPCSDYIVTNFQEAIKNTVSKS